MGLRVGVWCNYVRKILQVWRWADDKMQHIPDLLAALMKMSFRGFSRSLTLCYWFLTKRNERELWRMQRREGFSVYSCLCRECNAIKKSVVCPTCSGQKEPSRFLLCGNHKGSKLTLPCCVKHPVEGFPVLIWLLDLLRSTTLAFVQWMIMQQNSVLV